MADEKVDYSKLPWEERCVHKIWSVRQGAYEDLLTAFDQLSDEKSTEWNKYTGLVRKFPIDANVAAQEKGLEATLKFMENAHCAGRIVGEVVKGIIAKCITTPKARTKELASEIVLMCVEIEKYETVQEELMTGMEQKNPKVVAGCLSFVTKIVNNFGHQVVNLKPLIKKIFPLAEDRDKTVREETKKLIIELHRWIGDALKPHLLNLKPVVVQELTTEFSKLAGDKPTQQRYLRSQQNRIRKSVDGEDDVDDDNNEVTDSGPAELDPYDLIDPVDILSQIPKDFYDKCAAKKWQERKDALEALEQLANNPKIEPGDFSELVKVLKRLLGKDTNVLVVALAAKCIAGLANGLKKKFFPYAASCLETIMEKFKEKKVNVLTATRDASDACMFAASYDNIQEHVIKALQNKNPSVKAETCLMLARSFAKTPYSTMSDKKLMKPYLTAIIANLNESDPNVRDAAVEAFGVVYKHIGEKPLHGIIQDIDPIKMQKIKESAEKAVITAPKCDVQKTTETTQQDVKAKKAVRGGGGKVPAGTATKKPTPTKNTKSMPESTPPKPNTITTNNSRPSEENKKPVRTPVKAKESHKKLEDPVGTNLASNTLKCQRIHDENKLKLPKWNFSTPRAEFIELLKDLMINAGFGQNLMTQMFSADFKMHLKAIETLTAEMNKDMEGTICNLDLILKWLSLRFFDTNPSVLSKSLEYLQSVFRALSELTYHMGDVEANAFIPYLALKMGDPKDSVRTNVHQIFRILTSIHPPQKIFLFVMEGLKSKNARQRAECLDELAYLISTFGISVCQPSASAALKEVAKHISYRDNAVRSAALNCVVQAHYIEGDKIYKLIGSLADKDQYLLDERIKRAAKNRPSQLNTFNGVARPVASGMNGNGSGSHGGSGNGAVLNNSFQTASVPIYDDGASPSRQSTGSSNDNISQSFNSAALSPRMDAVFPNIGDLDSHALPNPTPPKAPALPEKYRINFDYYDNMFGPEDKLPMPELKLHDTGIEDILNEAPVALPKRKYNIGVKGMNSKDLEEKSVPTKAALSIDHVVAHMGSNDIRRATESILQLESMLQEPDVAIIMSSRVDHMMSILGMQMRRFQSLLVSCHIDDIIELNHILRCIVNLLMSLYMHDILPKKATKVTLKELIYQMLVLIVDRHMSKLADSNNIMKGINVLVVRIIEKSDPNAACSGLIRLLNDSLSLNQSPKMLELVMKCEWKLLKLIGVWVDNKDYAWNLSDIFYEFNSFMMLHPCSSFRDKDTTPLKTIKTIIHSLVYGLGPNIVSDAMSNMPELARTEAGQYINKLVTREKNKTGVDKKHRNNNAAPRSADHSTT